MSLKIEGESCARCKAYLFSEDDIVYCPDCGAPHHRECYNALGHCALEQLHGTDEQYSPEKIREAREKAAQAQKKAAEKEVSETVTACNMCGEQYNTVLPRCPKCGAPNLSRNVHFQGFDLLGGVPADFMLDENVTANDAKQFILTNTHRYIPKFAVMNKQNRVSWNWMAFLFPCGWMLSRKMYKNGIIAGILSVMVTLLSYPLNLTIYNLGIDRTASYPQLLELFAEALPKIGASVIIFALLGLIFDLGIRVFSAMLGDYFYKKYTVNSIKKIKSESDDISFDFRKKGGVNIFLFFLGTMAVQYLPNIILTFI
ncbi:MAG: DUF2628 domain-containing protein [Clostridia bacterium]|nr:DUF2628 domain-containing protein [Clostridia bacterium]